jgi:hypothetical protein
MREKVAKWNEDKLQLSKEKYFVSRFNTISLAEKQRLQALLGNENINSRKPLFLMSG